MSSCSKSEKVTPAKLVVGRTYRIINEWYAHNYMNKCLEIFTGAYVKQIQINENITLVFSVNGQEKYVSDANEFYLLSQDNNNDLL